MAARSVLPRFCSLYQVSQILLGLTRTRQVQTGDASIQIPGHRFTKGKGNFRLVEESDIVAVPRRRRSDAKTSR